MTWLWRWLKWLARIIVGLGVLLLVPVGYTEVACRGTPVADSYQPIITDPAWQRAESRTLMTYPEWHIVHAYDDYARVISVGDPHQFGYLTAIAGFWTALCPLSKKSASMGGVSSETRMTIYTIGVSFTAELLAKSLYEETLGRIATLVRGTKKAPLDDLSASQATDYAEFLQQAPWYKWDFQRDIRQLQSGSSEVLRDRERRLALGLEFRAKSAYASVIADAVAQLGEDQLRIRSVVTGISTVELAEIDSVRVVGERPEGLIIESDRYRDFTKILERLAFAGGDIVEIAGNNDILFTAISDDPDEEGALISFRRQGFGDWRHLVVVPVKFLGERFRTPGSLVIEHVHDY